MSFSMCKWKYQKYKMLTYLSSYTISELPPTTVKMSLSFLVISFPKSGLFLTTTLIFGGSFIFSILIFTFNVYCLILMKILHFLIIIYNLFYINYFQKRYRIVGLL